MYNASYETTIMTNAIQNPITNTTKDNAGFTKLDGPGSYDYLPMNIYVEPRTMKEHFQGTAMHHDLSGVELAAGHGW